MVYSSMKLSLMFGVLLAFLSLLSAQPGQTDPDKLSTNQMLLQRGLQQLDAMEPGMDEDTKKHLGAMKNILQRVCLDRQHATDSEVQVAAVLLRADPNRGPEDAQKQLRASLSQMPGIASEPKFLSGTRRVPGGETVDYVDVTLNGNDATVIELPAGARSDVAPQAAAAADRLRSAEAADPLWWTRLTVGRQGADAVVTTPDASDGYLIRATPGFAHEWGLTPEALAHQLVVVLPHVMDASTDLADWGPEEKYQAAVGQRQAGDLAYSRHNAADAESAYRAAIRQAPAYAVPYARLADLDLERRDAAGARAVLAQALQVSGLDPQWKAMLRQRLGQLRSSSRRSQ